jgi:DNA invertase Pin-like site-specific DNA recombinase
MKRALIYCRVSSDDKGKNNLDEQERECLEYCKKKGYTVIAVLKEDERGVSGKRFDAPMFERAIELAQNDTYDIFVVREIDRLARKAVKHSLFKLELEKAGVRAEYVIQEFSDDPSGRFQEQLMASVAELEAALISRRLLRGRRKNARNGEVVGCGKCVYGLQFAEQPTEKSETKTTLVANEYAPIVVEIFDMFVRQKKSARTIAVELSKRRVPTWQDLHERRTGRKYKRRKAEYGTWRAPTVNKILSNEIYTGVWRFGEFTVDVDPLIDLETWNAAQTQKAENQNRAELYRKTAQVYLLSGMIFCECGASMSGQTSKYTRKDGRTKQYVYYRCNAARQRHDYSHRCTKKAVKASIIENTMWVTFESWLDDPDNLEKTIREQQASREQAQVRDRQRLATFQEQLAEKQAEYERVIDLYISGDFSKELLVGKKAELERVMADINVQIEKITEGLGSRLDAEKVIAALRETLKEYKHRSRKGKRSKKMIRDFLEAIGTRVTVFDDEIELFSMIGESGFVAEKTPISGCFSGHKNLTFRIILSIAA